MPRDHPLAARRRIELRDLRGVRLVVPHVERPHRIMLDQVLGRAGVQWDVAVEASGWELMIHFVELGLGLAIVNACCRLRTTLTARPMPELPSLQYSLLWRRGSVDHPGAKALLDRVRGSASEWQKERGSAFARAAMATRRAK